MRIALLALLTTAVACSGGRAKTPGKATAGAGTEAGAPKAIATSPVPTTLPPMAAMPPPGVAGSKKGKRRPDPALAACSATARVQGANADAQLKVVAGACGAKLKPLGAVMRGRQGDKDPHEEQTFRAEANHCYRVYVAGDEQAKDLVVVLRDSAGDVVAESPGPAIPDDGAACFSAADQVTVLVGVGSGKGAWAAQVVSD